MKRQLYLWHRYLGIGLCLLFALWFVSGVVMMYVRMPILDQAERLAYLEPFDPEAVRIAPVEAAAIAELFDPPRRLRLASFLGRPIYYLLPRGERWIGVFADDGERLGGVGPERARTVAARAYPGRRRGIWARLRPSTSGRSPTA